LVARNETNHSSERFVERLVAVDNTGRIREDEGACVKGGRAGGWRDHQVKAVLVGQGEKLGWGWLGGDDGDGGDGGGGGLKTIKRKGEYVGMGCMCKPNV
jgi:hypothetical protein